MKYLPINNHLFIDNRARFVSIMKEGSLAVFNSNDVMPTNADGLMPFRQNNDLFYLSGIDQEESILVLFSAAKDEKHKEILFLKETSDEIAIWEGAKLLLHLHHILHYNHFLMLNHIVHHSLLGIHMNHHLQ